MEKNKKIGNNKKSIVGFFLTVIGALFVVWEPFEAFALVGLLLCIVGLFETIKNKNKLFYPIAGIILGAIFSTKLFISSFIYLCSSYNTLIGSLSVFVCILGFILLGFGIYYLQNSNNKKRLAKSAIIVGAILIILFCISFLKVSDTEDRLEFKLKEFGKEFFENDTWTKGGINEGTYSVNLNDLSKKFKKDVTIFDKYKCNKETTRVEFVVHKQLSKDQTNYTYNIILDCDL